MSVKHGWYSHKAAHDWGSVIYHTPDGGEVEVAAVNDSLEPATLHEDLVYVGIVTSYIRPGVIGVYKPFMQSYFDFRPYYEYDRSGSIGEPIDLSGVYFKWQGDAQITPLVIDFSMFDEITNPDPAIADKLRAIFDTKNS